MKMLLDENLPDKLLKDLPAHQLYTTRKMGWLGLRNGTLIKLMIENRFDALITFDKNIRFQQNFAKYPMTVFLLVAEKNTYKELSPLMPKVEKHLKEQLTPTVIIIT
jgi:predicted nuclease of predicted toxin-antitoxin system